MTIQVRGGKNDCHKINNGRNVIMLVENIIMAASAVVTLMLFVFAVDWRYFRDWVAVFLFKALLALIIGSMVVEAHLLSYPVRLFPQLFDTSLLFELWVLPTLCIVYNQTAKKSRPWPVIYRAILFSAGITLIEYFVELHTDLLVYLNWSWMYTFLSLTVLLLISRVFIAFFRWGCKHYPH
jgi:hypothetical protein